MSGDARESRKRVWVILLILISFVALVLYLRFQVAYYNFEINQLKTAIKFKKWDEADRQIKQLKAGSKGDSLDVAYLEGERWLTVEDFAKARPCFERASALKPNDQTIQYQLAKTLVNLKEGDRVADLERAIEILSRVQASAEISAVIRDYATYHLARAWDLRPVGDPNKNLRTAIHFYEIALSSFTREKDQDLWGIIKNNEGLIWTNLGDGDVAKNIENAIECLDAAMQVRTRERNPEDWAVTQTNLGRAWHKRKTGDRDKNFQKSLGYYQNALQVFTREKDAWEWARTQNNIGVAWSSYEGGDANQNLRQAIACFQPVLEVWTREKSPRDWALTQENLGYCWYALTTGDFKNNLAQAISYFEASQVFRTRQAVPQSWARTQVLLSRSKGLLSQRTAQEKIKGELLQGAISSAKGALTVIKKDTNPDLYRIATGALVQCRQEYEVLAVAKTTAFDAIPPAK